MFNIVLNILRITGRILKKAILIIIEMILLLKIKDIETTTEHTPTNNNSFVIISIKNLNQSNWLFENPHSTEASIP